MLRVGSIVLRVDDLRRQTEFWQAALGYVRRADGRSGDSFCSAARTERRPPDGDYVILADPEGNRFCVVDTERRR